MTASADQSSGNVSKNETAFAFAELWSACETGRLFFSYSQWRHDMRLPIFCTMQCGLHKPAVSMVTGSSGVFFWYFRVLLSACSLLLWPWLTGR